MKYEYSFYGKDTLSVSKDLYEILDEKVPYLISMVSSDLSKMILEEKGIVHKQDNFYIRDPKNEPVIGVIDTLFDKNVYFSKWVQNTDYLSDIEKMMLKNSDRMHGTEVTSIIVDGPRLNPWLDDGCGNFRVRHFGVCEERISIANLVNKIKKIVSENPDIHVWNLSLGTEEEISVFDTQNGYVIINTICRCRANEFNWEINPQLELIDYEIINKSAWDF